MIDILLQIALSSLWICGIRAITSEGMIFYFLRKPFEGKPYLNLFGNMVWLVGKNIDAQQKIASNAYDKKLTKPTVNQVDHIRTILSKDFEVRKAETLQLAIKRYCADLKSAYQNKVIKRSNVLKYIMKPIILCTTCMGSVHGLICYSMLCDSFILTNCLFVMLGSAFVGSLMWSIYDS